MLVNYNWLSQYVDVSSLTPEELAERITRAGIEVEGVETLVTDPGVVVGYVKECVKHPEADKLSVCQVEVRPNEVVQIVCGASNIRADVKVFVATVGTVLPGNFKIKKAKLRGQVSEGMICSLQELGFEGKVVPKAYSEGIFIVPTDANVEVGTSVAELIATNAPVLELSITPNRADALSMIGVAYEVAAILGTEVKLPEVNVETQSKELSIVVDAADHNPLYIGAVVEGVTVKPSPLWLQARLMRAGIRPLNNVVDITNFVLLEYGQPMHAFDVERFGGTNIVVRLAEAGETIETLDGVERTLENDELVITNGSKVHAIAGVMGGKESEVRNDSTRIILESAYFASHSVRKTSRRLALRSESSNRFEKGIAPERTALAMQRALQLLVELADAQVVGTPVAVENTLPSPVTLEVSSSAINNRLGTSISTEEMQQIFTRLGFSTQCEGENFVVTVPTRRPDITIFEDLVEEIGRMYGYDNIPTTLPTGPAVAGRLSPLQQMKRNVRSYLEGAGIYEAVTYSLTRQEWASRFTNNDATTQTALSMPMSEMRAVLRQSLVPHLLECVSYNQNRKEEDVCLFEMANVFLAKKEDGLPTEELRLAGALSGTYFAHPWQGEKRVVDFFVVKGIIDGLFTSLGMYKVEWKQAQKTDLHPGRTAEVLVDGNVVGFVGAVHPNVAKEFGVKETYVFEFNLTQLSSIGSTGVQYEAIPRFPEVTRDVAWVVDTTVSAGQIQAIVEQTASKLLKDVRIFDLYAGDRLPEGKKSIAFTLVYRDNERTLTEEDVTAVHSKILAAVEAGVQATVRS
ncbi:MAG: phenylalanine--tRNA ligase subunit beta [Bacilli bacterium]